MLAAVSAFSGNIIAWGKYSQWNTEEWKELCDCSSVALEMLHAWECETEDSPALLPLFMNNCKNKNGFLSLAKDIWEHLT